MPKEKYGCGKADLSVVVPLTAAQDAIKESLKAAEKFGYEDVADRTLRVLQELNSIRDAWFRRLLDANIEAHG